MTGNYHSRNRLPMLIATLALSLLYGLPLAGETPSVQAAVGTWGFKLPPVPAEATATVGYSLYTQYRFTVEGRDGFSGTIDFSVPVLPVGVNAHFDYLSRTLSSSVTTAVTTLLVAADARASLGGPTPLTVIATGGGMTDTATVGLVVDNFTLMPNSGTLIVPRRGSASYIFTVTPEDGFVGNLYFQVRGLPKNATATFNPQTVTVNGVPATTTMTVTTKGGTPVGTYPLVVSPYLWAQEARVTLVVP